MKWTAMKLILKIAFDSRTRTQFDIENPPHIPDIGDIVNIKLEDYLTDVDDIKKLNEYSENGIWKAGFKTITYEKDTVIVLIVLEEEENFKKNRELRY